MRNHRFNLATISVALCLLLAAAGPASATTTTFTLDSNPVVAFSFGSPVSGGLGKPPVEDFMVTLPPSPFEQTLTVGAHFSSMILDAFADINNTPTLVETITFGDDFVASNTLRSSSSGGQVLADVTIDFQTETIDFINPNGGPIGGGTAPEPSTLLLFGSGLGSLLACRKWRGNRVSRQIS
jgi:hypothetical protein